MTESILLDLTKKKFEIWQSQDKGQLQQFFDDRGLLFDLEGQVETKDQISDKLTSEVCILKEAKYQNPIVRIYETSAVVHGEGQFLINMLGESKEISLSFLDVWLERKEGWKLVSSHYSRSS